MKADRGQPREAASSSGQPGKRRAATSPRASPPTPKATREVACTWCGGGTSVSPSAQSVVCPHCNKRLVVEDFRTASYHAVRLVATCGDAFIDKGGHVVAAVHSANLTVAGKLAGNAVVAGRVIIQSTASVKGDVKAAKLRVESGATLEGHFAIGSSSPGHPAGTVV